MRNGRLLAALAVLVAVAVPAPPADAAFGFGPLALTFTEQDSSPATQAGSHPYAWTTSLALDSTGSGSEELPDGSLKDLRIQLPPGLVGTPGLVPRCSHAEFAGDGCPAASQVGTVSLQTSSAETDGESFPLYNLEPLPGNAAEIAFVVKSESLSASVAIPLRIATAPPYNLIASIADASQAAALLGFTLTVEGVPGGAPFLTLPRSCAPAPSIFEADSWQAPGAWVSATAPAALAPTGCGALQFSPTLTVTPTATAAHTPSGLGIGFESPDEGLTSATGIASADLGAARLELPPGMTINPALAAGLGACDPAQLAAEAPASEAGGCPQSARIGSAEVVTPLLDKPVEGAIYVATPDDPATPAPGAENPLDARYALYLVLRDPDRGVLLRIPIGIDADPASGRLTATLSRLPQLPLSRLSLRFGSGPRAPLTTPPGCGRQTISYSLMPSSGNPPLKGEESFTTDSGCAPAFAPELQAGTTSNAAGSAAPFVVELRNDAGGPNLGALHLVFPPGLAADLSAVATCPEVDATAAACPAASRLGFARIALGSGPEPLWVPGGSEPDSGVYLAGPYRGAPFSLLVSVPAAAGPFDLGTVVLRAPVRIDPDTARLSVDLAELPQIRGGIPLHYRVIRLVLDRPGFVRNPTSCEPMRIELSATAAGGAGATGGARFQAADCAALGFRPRLGLRFAGALGRNGHPRVEARLASRSGQANLAGATVNLPAGELLDTRHIRAICARDLPAARCPTASQLGSATVRSPLLPDPLRGPIFLRASSGRYPVLVAELEGGGVRILVHGRIASGRGGRLRVRLVGLPDLPLSKAAIALAGRRRGILVNSEALCGGHRRATVALRAHNGRRATLHPALKLAGC